MELSNDLILTHDLARAIKGDENMASSANLFVVNNGLWPEFTMTGTFQMSDTVTVPNPNGQYVAVGEPYRVDIQYTDVNGDPVAPPIFNNAPEVGHATLTEENMQLMLDMMRTRQFAPAPPVDLNLQLLLTELHNKAKQPTPVIYDSGISEERPKRKFRGL